MKKLASLLLLVAACGGTPVPPSDPDPSGPTTGAGPTNPVDGAGGAPANPGMPDAGTTAATTGGGTDTPAQPDKPKTQAELVAAADATRGAKLYQELSCGGCHGTMAKPSTKFPNLFAIKWDDHEVHEAFEVIKKGDSPMPPFGDKVDDAQIADIVKFLQTK